MAVVQHLMELDKFRGQELETKVKGMDFGGVTVIGHDENGKPLRKRTKEYMKELIYRIG